VIEMIKNVLYLASGVAIGYYVAHRRLEGYFNERLDKEIDDAKSFYKEKYRRKAAQDIVQDPEFFEDAVKAAKALKEYQGLDVSPDLLAEELTDTFLREEERAAEADEEEEGDGEEDDAPPEVEEPDTSEPESEEEEDDDAGFQKPVGPPVSIIPEQATGVGTVNYNRISTAPKEPTDQEKEAAYVPEVIDKEAFINGDSGFEQSTVTYFAGDDVLANDRDLVITADARETFLGPEIFELLKADPEARGGADAVYVRNTLRSREFEIILSPGKYSDEVGEVVYATG
jgi:hypothetical protein